MDFLHKPKLAKCNNRDLLPKENQYAGGPEEWFDQGVLTEFGLHGFCYDFFVDWSINPEKLSNMIWIKRIVDNKIGAELIRNCDRGQVIDIIKNSELSKQLPHIARYCNKHKLRIQLLIYREIDWSVSPECIVVIEVRWIVNSVKYFVSMIGVSELKERIKMLSGGSISIGAKGLIYGTSLLECYLSRTDSLYPGDVDMVLVDENYNNVAIIEFKKHNLNTPIRNQTLSNYYPRPDQRKYDRISILSDYFIDKPKLYVLYYPTKNTDGSVIECISGGVSNLVSSKKSIIDLPVIGNKLSYSNYVKNVLNFIYST